MVERNVYVFGAAVDTIVAGIYAYDTWAVEAESKAASMEQFEMEDPWADKSTSVAEYIGSATEVAGRKATVREILEHRYKEDDNAE